LRSPLNTPRPLVRITLSSLWFLVCVEVLARLAMSTEALPRNLCGRGPAANTLGIEALTARSSAAFLERRNAVPLEWDTDLGWRVRANMEVRKPDYATTADAQGFRTTPAGGPIPVLAVGDSFGFGIEVSDNEVWTTHVLRALPEISISNAAVPGYGHDQIWMRLGQLAPTLQPTLVIVPWVDADLVRNTRESFVWAKPRFEVVHGQLTQVYTPPSPEDMVSAYVWRSRTWDILRVTASLMFPPEPPDPADISVALAHALPEAAGGVPVLLVRAPVPWQLDQGRHRYEVEPATEIFARACASPGITCVDAGDAFFDARDEGASLTVESHWDAQGQRLLAEAVLKGLETHRSSWRDVAAP
jgi:hypothetical protein